MYELACVRVGVCTSWRAYELVRVRVGVCTSWRVYELVRTSWHVYELTSIHFKDDEAMVQKISSTIDDFENP